MDCGYADDACNIQQAVYAEIALAADELHVNAASFSIGEFNGRKYTYTWFGHMPVIVIESVPSDDRIQKTDYFPENVLISDIPDDIF